MAKFIYNNAGNASISYAFLELYRGNYPHFFLEDKMNLYLRSYFADKLAKELGKFMLIYIQNLFFAPEL